MRRAALVLTAVVGVVVIGIMATRVLASQDNDVMEIRLKVSGSATMMQNEAGSVILGNLAGQGTLGTFDSQSFFTYLPVNPSTGNMVCTAGQMAIRFDSTGAVLLLQATPGLTGKVVTGDAPGRFLWTQAFSGTVVGGTGRFEGATGTFTAASNGSMVVPGFVQPMTGTFDIRLDRR